MKQPYRVLLLIVAVILLLSAGWLVFGHGEPSYQGRTLTQWLRAAQGESPESDSVEARVIRHIGTNAIPTLLAYVAAKDTPLTKFLLTWRVRHPRFYLPVSSRYDKESLGEIGFALLGPEGKSAVPELIPLLRENDYAEWTSAARCLASIGPAAEPSVPDLIKVCERENAAGGNSSAAAYALGRIGPSAQSAAPALNAGLTNPSPMCGIFSQAALINIHAVSIAPLIEQLKATNNAQSDAWTVIQFCGTNGRPALPLLISRLNTRNRDLQAHCLAALGALHQQPDACIPAIVPFLNSKDDRVRWVALEALRAFGKSAKPAVPALLRCFDDTYDEVRKSATNALREIDPESAARAGVK